MKSFDPYPRWDRFFWPEVAYTSRAQWINWLLNLPLIALLWALNYATSPHTGWWAAQDATQQAVIRCESFFLIWELLRQGSRWAIERRSFPAFLVVIVGALAAGTACQLGLSSWLPAEWVPSRAFLIGRP